jgi:CheY-like chemotaxis protein
MGGELAVSSRPGEGSTFFFSVPLVLPEAASGTSPGLPDAPTAPVAKLSGRVLLVEDNPVNQEVGRGMLASLGVDVEVAPDGRGALAALARGTFHAVLMDCQMPGFDGYETAGWIRDREGKAGGRERIPIVAVTAHAMEGDREECLSAGMDDYLRKPFSRDRLASALAPWLASGPTRGPGRATPPTGGDPLKDGCEPPPAPPSPGPIDPTAFSALRELERNGAAGLVARATSAFLISAPTQVAAMSSAVALSAAKALARAAHSLKSACGYLGALNAQGLCARLESLGTSGSCEGAGPLLAALDGEIRAVLVALEAEGLTSTRARG